MINPTHAINTTTNAAYAAIAPLLDLETLDLADPATTLGFERPFPAWAWFLIILAAVAFAAWSYARLAGPRTARIALATVRTALLLAIALLIAGPQLVQRTESIERDWVIVLVDRSASLTIADVESDQPGPRLTREQQLRNAIADSWPMWQELAEQRTLVWLGFDAGAYDLPVRFATNPNTGEPPNNAIESIRFEEPTGQRTSLNAALTQAVARAAARPLAAIVILSDGRSIDAPARRTMRALAADGVPVHTVALGARQAIADVAVARVDAPSSAFVGDIVPVRVDLEKLATDEQLQTANVRVQLVDRATGIVLDEQPANFQRPDNDNDNTNTNNTTTPPDDDNPPPDQSIANAAVVLTHRAEAPDERDWDIRLVTDSPDLIPDNNTRSIAIRFTDDPIRILYIDGYPRWEQRYLRTLLIRERSITSSNLLLAPDRRFTQEGNTILNAIPASPEEWAEFTVIILGDVRPDVFTSAQLDFLKQHIAERGAGLIWIAGPGATPNAWFDTPLADLLPIQQTNIPITRTPNPVVASPTPAAQRLGVLQIADEGQTPWPPAMSDPSLGWPQLFYAQQIPPQTLKPTAETLATIAPAPDLPQTPLALTMRYGAGRSLYIATDETWRWRYARGEVRFERFWLQLIRMLARPSLARLGQAYTLSAAPQQPILDQPVRLVVELLDQALIDADPTSIRLAIQRDPDPGSDEPPPPTIQLELLPADGRETVYETIWLPPEPGNWSATILDRALFPDATPVTISVAPPDDELRQAQTDHPALQRLAETTNALALAPNDIQSLANAIPNRELKLVGQRTEALWDTPAALILILTLLLVEWVGRRFIRLI